MFLLAAAFGKLTIGGGSSLSVPQAERQSPLRQDGMIVLIEP
jgi:hypothetical protein